mmetsp:Transcript_81442/g.122363  ORF Transcript_81442/g.122363 Transcript_81442/m.122363 type:complete len:389 (+) Transcript_81442:518-1684(+)
MFLAEGGIRRKVDEEALQIAQGHHSLRRGGALVRVVFATFVKADLSLNDFTTLSFGNHPNKVGTTLHNRGSYFVRVDFWGGWHLQFRHVDPPLTTITTDTLESTLHLSGTIFEAQTVHTSRSRQRVLNPCHFVRILAHFPSGGMEEVSMHSPFCNLGVFFTHVRDANERRHQERRRRRVGNGNRDTVGVDFGFRCVLVGGGGRGGGQVSRGLQERVNGANSDHRGPLQCNIQIVVITADQVRVSSFDSRVGNLLLRVAQERRSNNQILHSLFHETRFQVMTSICSVRGRYNHNLDWTGSLLNLGGSGGNLFQIAELTSTVGHQRIHPLGPLGRNRFTHQNLNPRCNLATSAHGVDLFQIPLQVSSSRLLLRNPMIRTLSILLWGVGLP